MKKNKSRIQALENNNYVFLLSCKLSSVDIVTRLDNISIKKNFYTEQMMRAGWKKEKDSAKRNHLLVFNSPGLFLRRWYFDKDNKLHLNFGKTSFKEFIGIYKYHPEIYSKYGVNYVPMALATFGILTTLDNKIVLAKRSEKVSGAKNMIAPIGGFLEKRTPKNGRIEKGLFIFNSFNKEIIEEIGIPKKNIVDTIFSGIVVKKGRGGLPRFIFQSKINLTSLEIENIFLKNGNHENKKLVFIKKNKESLKYFLNKKNKSTYWTTEASITDMLARNLDC